MNPWDHLQERILQHFGILARPNCLHQIRYALKVVGSEHSLSEKELAVLALQKNDLLRELAGFLTVEESYFFRHERDFATLASYALFSIEQRPNSPFVIWSAGCSDGAEPYSAAIALWERLPVSVRPRLHILATDINRLSLQKATEGHYSNWSLRGLDEKRRHRFFQPTQNGYQLREDIRAMVDFNWLSLQEQATVLERESVDCIFFRNVAIYLNSDTTRKLTQQFHRILRPNGLLFQAACDGSLPSELFRLKKKTYSTYNKAVAQDSRIDPTTPSEVLSKSNIVKQKKYSIPTSQENPATLYTQRALQHANRGDFCSAIAVANTLVQMADQNKMGCLLRGKINLAQDKVQEAVTDLRQAVFYDPQNPLARFWYAYALFRQRATRRAMLQTNRLLSQLSDIEGTKLLNDGTTTVSELRKATQHLKGLTS